MGEGEESNGGRERGSSFSLQNMKNIFEAFKLSTATANHHNNANFKRHSIVFLGDISVGKSAFIIATEKVLMKPQYQFKVISTIPYPCEVKITDFRNRLLIYFKEIDSSFTPSPSPPLLHLPLIYLS